MIKTVAITKQDLLDYINETLEDFDEFTYIGALVEFEVDGIKKQSLVLQEDIEIF